MDIFVQNQQTIGDLGPFSTANLIGWSLGNDGCHISLIFVPRVAGNISGRTPYIFLNEN